MENRKKSQKKKQINKIIASIISLIILGIIALVGTNDELLNAFSQITRFGLQSEEQATNNTNSNKEKIEFIAQDNLKIYFIDVGQADCILIINKDETMLIDAGRNIDGQNVVNFIKGKGITKLNYVIGTHPHEDHIGGLDDVIYNFEIENLYMPKIETTTKTFEDVLDAISNKGLKVTAPKKGDTFKIGDSVCEVMTESILDKKNLNLSSIVIQLEFGNNSFLFTGDAETKNENSRQWEQVDLLKVGHHGSNTSSGESFINQVKPTYSVIMVGENNSYGLPRDKVLERLENINSVIYRTDRNGTIEVTSDGNEIAIKTEK